MDKPVEQYSDHDISSLYEEIYQYYAEWYDTGSVDENPYIIRYMDYLKNKINSINDNDEKNNFIQRTLKDISNIGKNRMGKSKQHINRVLGDLKKDLPFLIQKKGIPQKDAPKSSSVLPADLPERRRPLEEKSPSELIEEVIQIGSDKKLLNPLPKIPMFNNTTLDKIMKIIKQNIDKYGQLLPIIEQLKQNPILKSKSGIKPIFIRQFEDELALLQRRKVPSSPQSAVDDPSTVVDVLAMGRKRVTSKQILKHLSSKKKSSQKQTQQLKVDIMKILRS